VNARKSGVLMPINHGKMDRRITIQTLTESRGSAGGIIEGWSNLDTVWAEKLEQGTREFRAAGSLHAEASRLFRIRYRTDVRESHRISFGGRLHDILGISEEERGQTMLLNCKFTEGQP
jgi:SPP1 family predicted phage head-tail adaptor